MRLFFGSSKRREDFRNSMCYNIEKSSVVNVENIYEPFRMIRYRINFNYKNIEGEIT